MTLKRVFNRVVQNLERDFPEEMAQITIVDTAAPDAYNRISDWYDGLTPTMQKLMELQSRLGKDEIVQEFVTAGDFARRMPNTCKSLVGISIGSKFMFADEEISLASTLLHEAGHIIADPTGGRITGNPLNDLQNENKGEIIADSFSTIYGRRMGLMDKDDVSHISDQRGLRAWALVDLPHFTSPALDHLHLGKEDAYFVSLTPQEIKAIAQEHGEKFQPSVQDLQKAYEMLNAISPSVHTTHTEEEGAWMRKALIERLIEKTESLPQTNFTRAIAEKTIAQLLEKDMIKADTPIAKKAVQFLKGPV